MQGLEVKEPLMTKEEYDIVVQAINKKKTTLMLKRLFDLVVAIMLLIVLSPLLILFSLRILLDSGRPIFFRQERMGKYGKTFEIFKFRTMRQNTATADGITLLDDNRITKVGAFLRKYRLDEVPQLFNVIRGDMSFVGPRPDLPKYYEVEDKAYRCILLVKPGVTCPAALEFKDEEVILALSDNPEETYVNKVFPMKVELNLKYLRNISVYQDMKIMLDTFVSVFIKSESSKSGHIEDQSVGL